MELEGLDLTVEKIRNIGEDLDRHLASILYDVAEPRIKKMKDRTPVRDGHLKSSVKILPAKRTRQGIEVQWAAGGVATAYALVQHENLSFQHTVGQAKYISSVVYEDAGAMKSELQQGISELFSTYSV